MKQESTLDDDRVGYLLLKLSLPAFLGMFVITLYNVVDTIFVGRYVGSLGIAGLSIVFPVQMLSMGIAMMTGIGGASLISRSIGAGNQDRAEKALGNAITATLVFSVIMTIVGLSDIDFWLRLIGSSETILPYARDYMLIILFGIFLQTLAMTLSTLIRAEGNARVSMIGMVIGASLNIIFCAIFIIMLHQGVKGSAFAAVTGQLVSVIYYIRYYLSSKSYLKIRLKNLIPDFSILRGILAIGISSLAMTLAGSLTAVFVNRALVNYGGDLAVSTFGILNRIMMFANMPGMTVGQGLQPIVGFNYGAKRYDRILKAIKMAMISATCFGILAFLVLNLFPEPFIRTFTTESDLLVLGSHAARLLFLAMYLPGFIMTTSVIFQAIGRAVESFTTSIARPFLFLLPLIFILPHFWKLDGVWLAYPISDALAFILTLLLFIPLIREFRTAANGCKE